MQAHWSMRLLDRGMQAEVICAKLKDSWTSLGMISALVASMAFGEIMGSELTYCVEDICLVLAFALSIFATVNTVVLSAGLNSLPEEELLRAFLIRHSHKFRMETVLPFQVSLCLLTLALIVRASQIIVFNALLFAPLTIYNFSRHKELTELASELHEKFMVDRPLPVNPPPKEVKSSDNSASDPVQVQPSVLAPIPEPQPLVVEPPLVKASFESTASDGHGKQKQRASRPASDLQAVQPVTREASSSRGQRRKSWKLW